LSDNQRRRRGKSRRAGQRGQTLVIFALSFTVLLGLAGLAIDATRAYDLYARMQRAAEAGALAGVLYMPAYYNRIRPNDMDSAVSRASKEVVKNGFGTVYSPTASACSSTLEVSICPVIGKSDDLLVSIHETLDLVLLSGLGVQPVNLTATAQAEYLPPLQIGSRLNYFGDQVECYDSTIHPDPTQTDPCSPGSTGTLQSYVAAFNGPDELKENGDPYVYCEEGPSYSTTLDTGSFIYTAYNGDVTNHPQYLDGITNHCGVPTGVTPGNPDQEPPGFTGEATRNTAHPGAYNYYINVPSAVGNTTIWVYNPSYIPNSTGGTFDHFNNNSSNYFTGPNTTGIAAYDGHYDAPPFYFNVTYSLYQVASFFDRTSDTLVGTPQVYPPYDAVSSDVSLHCGSGYPGVYDPYWGGSTTQNSYNPPVVSGSGCIPLTFSPLTVHSGSVPAPCWQQWCPVFANLSPGSYRLAVEDTGLPSQTANYTSNLQSGYGGHEYALKVCPAADSSPISCADGANPGIQLSAWNNMDVYFSANLGTLPPNPADPSTTCITQTTPGTNYTCLDLVCIPTAYAGRSLTVQFFDPGDGGGDLYVGLAQAGVGTTNVTYPAVPAGNIVSIDGDTLVHAHFSGYNAFNGLWLTAAITLPSSYTGTCTPGQTQTGWWQMVYAGNNPGDNVAISFSLTGSPVHLLG
jgi:hypothetical protein